MPTSRKRFSQGPRDVIVPTGVSKVTPVRPSGKAFDLTQEAILVSLSIGAKGMHAKSKTLSEEAAATHQADQASVAGIVAKFSEGDLSGMTKIISRARANMYLYTLPWGDNADRLCPVQNFPTLKELMATDRLAFMDEVEKLVSLHPDMERDYIRRVGKVLAAELPFPTKQQLRGNFRFELRMMPLRDPLDADLRLQHVSAKQVAELKDAMASQMNDRLVEAQSTIAERLFVVANRIKETCDRIDDQGKGKDGKQKAARVHASLVTNLQLAVEILPALNLTHDPEVARLIERVKAELGGLDVEVLKKDEKTRKAIGKAASSVLDDIKRLK